MPYAPHLHSVQTLQSRHTLHTDDHHGSSTNSFSESSFLCKAATSFSTNVICPILRLGRGALSYKCRCAPSIFRMDFTSGSVPTKLTMAQAPRGRSEEHTSDLKSPY